MELFQEDRVMLECPETFVEENLAKIVETDISPYDFIQSIGSFVAGPMCVRTEARIVARINNARIWGEGLMEKSNG